MPRKKQTIIIRFKDIFIKTLLKTHFCNKSFPKRIIRIESIPKSITIFPFKAEYSPHFVNPTNCIEMIYMYI